MSLESVRKAQLKKIWQRSSGCRCRGVLAGFLALAWACSRPPSELSTVHLVDHFDSATVVDASEVSSPGPVLEWNFERPFGPGEEARAGEFSSPTLGWTALQGVEGLDVREGRLAGRSAGRAVLAVSVPGEPAPDDDFYALEVRMRAASGSSLGMSLMPGEQLPIDAILFEARMSSLAAFNIDLEPGEDFATYTLTAQHALFETSYPMERVRHIVLWPTDSAEAEFEIASVRLITQREHLMSVSSGVARQDLSGEVRESFVTRAPELVTFDVEVPADAYLELAVGSPGPESITFRVEATTAGGQRELLRHVPDTPGVWVSTEVDLAAFGGQRIELGFGLESESPGALGFWGSPVIRSRTGRPFAAEASPARDAALGPDQEPPRGVILILADTLRRDHLPFHGYARPTAPELTRLAGEGASFQDAIAQGTWTKVSVPSILSSLYPTTHGLRDMPDRLPDAVTTLAEVYREAGYATFATSSVPFTGRLSNLQQGFEVFLESSSLTELEPGSSKTARFYVDRLATWIEDHRDVPFFALLHVFDPHSPFEPANPDDSLWMDADEAAAHRKDMATVRAQIKDPLKRWHALPEQEELDNAGIDAATYVAREKAWYDASIRAMDAEIGRLRNRLEELGLGRSTLVVVTSDHGEEFLEHGRHFHGYTAYGEMLNVPLLFWWPGVIQPGIEVPHTVQTIDLLPTLLDLSRLPVPHQAQGRSLVPLLDKGESRASNWEPRPAFAERAPAPAEFGVYETHRESRAVIHDGWKLIHHLPGPAGEADAFELFRHHDDPLDSQDLSEQNPEVVAQLRALLDDWHRSARAERYEPDTEIASPEERDRLRALGYLQ